MHKHGKQSMPDEWQSMPGGLVCRGEVVEDVEPPLPLSTPLLLVKPPVGLSTPAVFRALDLGARSTADPQQLLSGGLQLLWSKLGFSGALCTVHETLRSCCWHAATRLYGLQCFGNAFSSFRLFDGQQSAIALICYTSAPAASSTVAGRVAGFVQG